MLNDFKKNDLIMSLSFFGGPTLLILDILNGAIGLTKSIGVPLFFLLLCWTISAYFFWRSRKLREKQNKSIVKLMQLKPELKVVEHRAKWQFNITNCLEGDIEIQPIVISFKYKQLNEINEINEILDSNNIPQPPMFVKSKAHKLKIGESVLVEMPIELPINYFPYQIKIESFEANVKCGKKIISLADSFPDYVQIKE